VSARVDHLVDGHQPGGAVRVGIGLHRREGRVARLGIAARDHVGRHGRVHERDLRAGPRVHGVDARVVAAEREVREPVGLAQDHRELRRLRERERRLQPDRVLEHPVVLDLAPDEEARDILHGDHRQVVGVAQAQQPHRLLAGRRVQRAREDHGLARDDADRVPVQAPEAAQQPAPEVRPELEQRAGIEHAVEQPAHVIGASAARRPRAAARGTPTSSKEPGSSRAPMCSRTVRSPRACRRSIRRARSSAIGSASSSASLIGA
jgi:hypothetical protein